MERRSPAYVRCSGLRRGMTDRLEVKPNWSRRSVALLQLALIMERRHLAGMSYFTVPICHQDGGVPTGRGGSRLLIQLLQTTSLKIILGLLELCGHFLGMYLQEVFPQSLGRLCVLIYRVGE